MPLIDYDNVTKRLEKAHKEVLEGGRLPEGNYNTVFHSGKITESRKQNDMIKLEFRIRSRENAGLHGKIIRNTYVFHLDWQVNNFLVLMDEMGVDITKVTCDEDWNKIFYDLEEDRPKVFLKLAKDNKNPQYNRITILKVGEDGKEEIHGEIPAAPEPDAKEDGDEAPLPDDEAATAAEKAEPIAKAEPETKEAEVEAAAVTDQSGDDTPY